MNEEIKDILASFCYFGSLIIGFTLPILFSMAFNEIIWMGLMLITVPLSIYMSLRFLEVFE